MSQQIEQQWAKALLTAIAGATEPRAFVRVACDAPYKAAACMATSPDAQGQLVLTLATAAEMGAEERAKYRLALASSAGLRRHAQVKYTASLSQGGEETVIARFAASLLEPQFVAETFAEMLRIITQAVAEGKAPQEDQWDRAEDDNAETETELLLQGGLRV